MAFKNKMVRRITYIGLLLLSVGVVSCNKKIASISSATYIHITESEESKEIQKAIAPYRGDMQSKMRQVVGFADGPLEKGKPNAPLGNYLCDLMTSYARKNLGLNNIDASIFNNGGFRIPLPGDSIRVETIFELMPFENELVVVELPADSMNSLAVYLQRRGGEPISRDIELEFVGGKIERYLVGEEEIDRAKIYYILTSDYLSGGGDNMNFFRGMKVKSTGVKLRDAIIYAMTEEFKEGKKAFGKIDNRLIIKP